MATVSLLRGRLMPHRTNPHAGTGAQGLVRQDAGRGAAPAATYDDGLRARNALGGEAWRQRELMKAGLTWLQL